MKPYKVTISHFLNKNLKPFIMDGENYYPIYLKITAKRNTTKLRSLIFQEYYTEEMYNDIMTSTETEDVAMVNKEVSAIERIARITINELNEFSTSFLYAFVDFSNTLDIWEADTEKVTCDGVTLNLYDIFENDVLYSQLKDDLKLKREPTLFEFYSDIGQSIIYKTIKKLSLKQDANDLKNDINKLLFYKSIEYFKYYIEGNRKTKPLKKQFDSFFQTYNYEIGNYMIEKYSN